MLFETQDFERLRILGGSNSFSTFLKLPLQLFGISKKIADLTPYSIFQRLSTDLPVATNALPSEAITVRPGASIVTIVLRAMPRASFARGLAVIGITTDRTAGKSL